MSPDPDTRVTHVMDPVIPGTYAVLTVGGGNDATPIYAIPLAGGPSARPGDGQVRIAGPAVRLTVAQRTDECFTVDMPAGPEGVWAFQTAPVLSDEAAWFANRARVNWCYPAAASPGRPLRVLGRNLVPYDRYPTTDPEHPVSFGGLLEPGPEGSRSHMTRAGIRRVGAAAWRDVEVRKASAYEAHLVIPGACEPGAYELSLHNGWGGAAGWSEPHPIDVRVAESWPTTEFKVDDYITRLGDTDAAFAAALADIAAHGGGILRLGPRTYGIRKTLVLPPRTVVRGASRERTLIDLPFNPPNADPPFVAITGDGDFAVEDLCLRGVYAPLLICAPTFLPATADEAARGWNAHVLERRARSVAVRRCILKQYPFRQTMRRPRDFDARGWMRSFAETGWAGIGRDHFACIAFRGEGLEVEGCTILGGGHAVDMNRTAYARIAGNVLKAGFFGMGVHGFTRLTWPADGTGARIEGNEMRNILVEDNDVSAHSEFARNLVSFNFGGDNLHVVRNHIHDIAPNCDSEALMTHLWQARWPEPTVRMTGPTTGRIVDPNGEVTHECLDGAWLDVVDGRGMGQLRRICRRDGDRIEIDRPWRCVPDETSRVVFTAPAPFRNLTMVDNRVVSEAVNIIVWGMSYDTVLDGNTVADGPGITVWSVRLAADQKVWGGATFTTIIHNRVERCYASPAGTPRPGSAIGIFSIVTVAEDAPRHGYDYLGLVIRDNHATDNSGIGFQKTFSRGGNRPAYGVRDAGIVLERNHVTDSVVGVVIEEGSRAVERATTSRNVDHPLTWAKPAP